MPDNFAGLFLVSLSFVVTFVVARVLGQRWRDRRRQREEEKARAGETRQMRRARERRQKR